MVHFFRNALGISASFIFLTSLILFSSCSDDDTVTDATAPEVSFTNLTDQSEVYNTVSVAVNATDNDGVEKVEVYIDGTLTSTLTQSPYEFSWDSNTATDGAHTIKVVVTDKTGNQNQKELSVQVHNILVSVNMSSNQLLTNSDGVTEKGYMFLSDENGKVIAYTECENGKSYQLKNSAFTGSSFYLTEFVVRTFNDGGSWYTIDTYSQIERGKNWVLVKNSGADESVGSAKLNFSNGDENTLYKLYAGEYSNYSYSSDNTSQSLLLLSNPSPVYITKTTEETVKYGLFPNVIVGENNIDLAEVDQDLKSASIALPDGTTASSISIFGLPVANSFTQRCWTGWQSADNGAAKLDLKYPGTAFPMYYWTFYYEAPDAFYSTASTNASFQLGDNITNNVSVAFADGKITYSASGEFDFLLLQNDFENGGWNYILPLGANQILPTLEVPDALSSYSLPSLSKPIGYGVYEFDGISSYDEIKNAIRQSTRGFDDLFAFGKTYRRKFYRESSSGGRKSNTSKRINGLW